MHYFSPQIIALAFVLLCNIIAFILVGIDKRKSVQHHERVPEVYFFVWSIFFSSLGVLAGMFVFHHKTRKWHFIWGVSILLIQQTLLAYLLFQKLVG